MFRIIFLAAILLVGCGYKERQTNVIPEDEAPVLREQTLKFENIYSYRCTEEPTVIFHISLRGINVHARDAPETVTGFTLVACFVDLSNLPLVWQEVSLLISERLLVQGVFKPFATSPEIVEYAQRIASMFLNERLSDKPLAVNGKKVPAAIKLFPVFTVKHKPKIA